MKEIVTNVINDPYIHKGMEAVHTYKKYEDAPDNLLTSEEVKYYCYGICVLGQTYLYYGPEPLPGCYKECKKRYYNQNMEKITADEFDRTLDFFLRDEIHLNKYVSIKKSCERDIFDVWSDIQTYMYKGKPVLEVTTVFNRGGTALVYYKAFDSTGRYEITGELFDGLLQAYKLGMV